MRQGPPSSIVDRSAVISRHCPSLGSSVTVCFLLSFSWKASAIQKYTFFRERLIFSKFRLKESIVIVSSRGWREGKKTTFCPLGFLRSDVVFFPSLHPLLDTTIFFRSLLAWEDVSRISRRPCGLTCMSMRRSLVSRACGWFNNAVVRAWIGKSLPLPWLFSRQTKPRKRWDGLDLTRKRERVCERESHSTCVMPDERLRQNLRKQTKNEVALAEG